VLISVFISYILEMECFEWISSVGAADPGEEGERFNPAGMWPLGVYLKIAFGLLAIC